jgi:hypothetical protein
MASTHFGGYSVFYQESLGHLLADNFKFCTCSWCRARNKSEACSCLA